MTVRIFGTVGYLTRNCVSNRSGLLRCCSVNYDRTYPSESWQCRQSLISRNFSFDSFTRLPTVIFRYIAESDISEYTRNVFIYVHDTTGLPWWGAVFLSGVALKIFSFPLRAHQIELMGRLQKCRSMDHIPKKVHEIVTIKAKKHMWPLERTKREFRYQLDRERKYLIQKYNCHPFKIILLNYLEFPVWIYMSITWRTMSYGFSDSITSSNILTEQMLVEGPFWCMNLTMPDPYYIWPALVLICQLAHVELGVIQANLLKKKQNWLFRFFTNFARVFGVLAAFICSLLPATVSIFWASSSGFALLREFVFMSPKVRYALKLPYEPISQKDVLKCFKERLLQLVQLKGKNGKGVI